MYEVSSHRQALSFVVVMCCWGDEGGKKAGKWQPEIQSTSIPYFATPVTNITEKNIHEFQG